MTETATTTNKHNQDPFIAYLAGICAKPGTRARLRRTLSAADPATNADVLILLGPFIPPNLDEGRLTVHAAIAGLYATYGAGNGQAWWSPGSELGASVRSGHLNDSRADRAMRSLLRPTTTADRIGILRRVLPSCTDPSRLNWSQLRRDLEHLATNNTRRVAQRWARDFAQQLNNQRKGDQQ